MGLQASGVMRRSLAWCLALCAAACGTGGAGEVAGAAQASTGDAGASPAVCSDSQAGGVLAAESRAEIELAMAVRGRLQSPDAVAFAEKTITDRSLALLQIEGELRVAGLAEQASGVSLALDTSAQLLAQFLQSESGAALDVAYADHEVVALAEELGVIDGLVTPAVRDARLAWAVVRTRAMVQSYATLAEQLQAALAGACGGAADM